MENTQKHYTGGEIKKARQSSSMGLIIRQKEPTNLETPFDQLDSFLTPTELFYIRSHFPAPKLDLASYWSFHNLGDVTALKKGPNQGRAFRHSL